MITLDEMKDDYSWKGVFEFAHGGSDITCGNASGSKPTKCEGAQCNEAPFGLDDVKRVVEAVEGEHDSEPGGG